MSILVDTVFFRVALAGHLSEIDNLDYVHETEQLLLVKLVTADTWVQNCYFYTLSSDTFLVVFGEQIVVLNNRCLVSAYNQYSQQKSEH